MNEDDMCAAAAFFEKETGMRSVSITIRYDATLQKITGTKEDPMILSEGSLFTYVLMNIFESHPYISEKYSPGMIGFARNGGDLFPSLPMQDGDIILCTVVG